MMPWDGWGWHWGMMLLMWLFWIALIAGIVLVITWAAQRAGRRTPAGAMPESEDPQTILKRRYARGEISHEEYERMRRELS